MIVNSDTRDQSPNLKNKNKEKAVSIKEIERKGEKKARSWREKVKWNKEQICAGKSDLFMWAEEDLFILSRQFCPDYTKSFRRAVKKLGKGGDLGKDKI